MQTLSIHNNHDKGRARDPYRDEKHKGKHIKVLVFVFDQQIYAGGHQTYSIQTYLRVENADCDLLSFWF